MFVLEILNFGKWFVEKFGVYKREIHTLTSTGDTCLSIDLIFCSTVMLNVLSIEIKSKFNFHLGVYISRASYVRQGEQSLDSFYSPWHLVEYYRYLRFFPDGKTFCFDFLIVSIVDFRLGIVLIFTSGETRSIENFIDSIFVLFLAEEPKQIVPRLKTRYSIRDPTLIYGNYRLQNNRVRFLFNIAEIFFCQNFLFQLLIIAQRTSTTTNPPQRRGAGRDPTVSEIEQAMHMVKSFHRIDQTNFIRSFRNSK